MNSFQTALEKDLWAMLYRSQLALSVELLENANQQRENENDWPAGQQWHELGNTSQAAFSGRARELAGIDHKAYLALLRENQDANSIAEDIWQYVQDSHGEIPPVGEFETEMASRDLLGASKAIEAQKRFSTPVFSEIAKKIAEDIKGVGDLSERRLAAFAKQNGLKMPEADLGTSE